MNESGVTLAILAGGRGERMGKPKGLLRVGDKPILSYLLERFAWKGPTMLVTSPGREKPPGAERFDVEILDPVEGMGPVRGVMTALENLQTELLIVSSVDMPLVGREQLLWLVEQTQERQEARGVMIERQRIEPFPSIFRKARAGCPWYVNDDSPSMRSLASIDGFAVLPAPRSWPDHVWTNLNEPADLASFEKTGLFRIQ
jgi:molybdopterin-guanine dinucleotide biosynthesis protein A